MYIGNGNYSTDDSYDNSYDAGNTDSYSDTGNIDISGPQKNAITSSYYEGDYSYMRNSVPDDPNSQQ